MPNLKKQLIITGGYTLLMLAFALYWGSTFSVFIHYKGEDVEITLWFAIMLTYLFLIALSFNGLKIKAWVVLIAPFALTVLSLFVGLLVLFVFSLRGTPREITLIYILTYVSICGLNVLWRFINQATKAQKLFRLHN